MTARFRRRGETALERIHSDPDGWRPTLTAEPERAEAGSDERLVEAAQRLTAVLDAEGTKAGRYRVDMRGTEGMQIGDYGIQSNVFNKPNT